MKLKHTFAFSSLLLAMGFQAYAQELPSEPSVEKGDEQIEEILIVGVRQDRVSRGATGLTMEINETPQSISVVSSEQIKNFAANNLNDALELATGINVEDFETNRTQYTSRGFEIKSTQIDGVGMPNSWGIVTGAMEAYGYEEIEIIRGANGILTGVGNSAGTINYVRKRPTNENQGEVGVALGSWDLKRIEADYSALLTDDGRWAARVVAVAEDQESYVDGLVDDRAYLYAIVDGQITENSTLTVGFSYQDANTDGAMWGGLVYNYTDGTQAEWDVGASTAQEWTMWDTENTTAFVEYAYEFNNDWELKTTYNRQQSDAKSKLFYAYLSTYSGIDKDTGLGLDGWPGNFGSEFTADLLDITTRGNYRLFGLQHEVVVGLSYAQSEQIETQYSFDYATTPAYGVLPVGFPYEQNAIAEPIWLEESKYVDLDVSLTRFFGSTKLNLSKDLFVVAGFNAIKYTREGVSSGAIIDNDESEVSPYAAITYSVTNDINVYASYSDVYQPLEQYDAQGQFLAPSKGINFEAGVKAQWLDDKLLTTFAVFTAEQEGLASYVGVDPETFQYQYEGINVDSQGFEIELVGQLTEYVNAVLAYTYVDVEDEAGDTANKWAARNVVNFSVDYTFPQLPEVVIGLGGKWQSKTENTDYNVKQDAYLVVNAFARWDMADNLALQANINNLTDEKYINSLYTVGYYDAPLNGMVSLTYRF